MEKNLKDAVDEIDRVTAKLSGLAALFRSRGTTDGFTLDDEEADGIGETIQDFANQITEATDILKDSKI